MSAPHLTDNEIHANATISLPGTNFGSRDIHINGYRARRIAHPKIHFERSN